MLILEPLGSFILKFSSRKTCTVPSDKNLFYEYKLNFFILTVLCSHLTYWTFMCSLSPALCENQLVLAHLRSNLAVVWILFSRVFWSTWLLTRFLTLLPFFNNCCREWLPDNQAGRGKFPGMHPCPQSATSAAVWTGFPCTGESFHVRRRYINYCNSLILVVPFHHLRTCAWF